MPMTISTTMPIASRRTFVGLGSGVIAAGLLAPARGATPPGLPAAPGRRLRRHAIAPSMWVGWRSSIARPVRPPVVLLLHRFPTSSRMFRSLIPMLADKYRVIAPDYPAFGHSAVPSRAEFQ